MVSARFPHGSGLINKLCTHPDLTVKISRPYIFQRCGRNVPDTGRNVLCAGRNVLLAGCNGADTGRNGADAGLNVLFAGRNDVDAGSTTFAPDVTSRVLDVTTFMLDVTARALDVTARMPDETAKLLCETSKDATRERPPGALTVRTGVCNDCQCGCVGREGRSAPQRLPRTLANLIVYMNSVHLPIPF